MPAPINAGKGGQISIALDGLARKTRAIALRNLREASALFQAEARKAVGRPGPGHSRPGEPPRRQSGRLQNGIVVDLDEARLEVRIRSSANYSGMLEKGTRNMAARPFMAPTWQRLKSRIAAIMKRRN